MDDNQILSYNKKGGDQTTPENYDDEWDPSFTKSGEDQIPPSEKHIEYQALA